MSKKKVLILIPARFASSRFPGKPLEMIGAQSMISLVLENCLKITDSEYIYESFVVTDDQRIEDHIKLTHPQNIVRVDDDVNSGTLRIQLAYERFFAGRDFDLIINVQGDEPLLQGEDLARLAKFHLQKKFDIATLVRKMPLFDEVFLDSNKVKAVISEETGRAFYFSRAPIPYKRDKDLNASSDFWFLHIGVYSYLPDALNRFATAKETRLENLEKLEQLRALEIGLSIGALETKSLLIGVDHKDDIKKVEEVLRGRK